MEDEQDKGKEHKQLYSNIQAFQGKCDLMFYFSPQR